MSAAGIIFSNVHDNNIPELTKARTIASVPFGCRYRFIDFTLSNMVNSNINNISVITNSNYLSLMDHIGSGKDWDLARRNGGIKILPPNAAPTDYYGKREIPSRLEALKSVSHAIADITDEYAVLSDSDAVCNINIKDIISQHIKDEADITFAVKKMVMTPESARRNIIIAAGEDGLINNFLIYPKHFSGEAEVCLNILVMRTEYLKKMITDSIAQNFTSLTRDIILRSLRRERERVNYRVYRYDGYFAAISSLEAYYRHSMDLIGNESIMNSLFEIKSRPVFTKVRNSAPTYYSEGSNVKNSLIADGCVIEGTVENSILFRGVKIGSGSIVKNSILMQDSICGENVSLNCIISDKNVVIRDGIMLSGISAQPYYISKGKML